MSEAATKRIALTTLSAPAKKENKEKEKPHESSKGASGRQPDLKTHRFVLTLPDSTEESCPEFNFADLLSSVSQPQKKKDNSTPHLNGSGQPPPLDPFASDDEDQLRNIAKKFEEKYGGPVGKKKKSKKYDEYVDLGAGYDETDPFIDNTDAYDEIVPTELTTAHGGFYINSGALEFKPVEEDAEGQSESGESGETESSSNESESDESDSEPNVPRKRRVIESDDDDSKDEGSPRNGKETASAAVNGSGETDSKKQTKKRIRLDDMVLKPPKKASPVPQESTPAASAVAAAPGHSKKIRPTVKELLQQKREREKDATDTKELAATAAKSGSDSGSDSSDSSSDSSESESESGSEGEGDEDGEGKDGLKSDSAEEVKTLPNNLPPTLSAAIEDIKKAAAASTEQGKCRFFSSEVNRFLLSIELLSRQVSCSKRQAVFSYLASFLPCTKHTLLKRAKNLVLESVEAQLKGAMKKLQAAIEKVIPEQIERHANECLQLAEANPDRYIEYYRYAWDPDLEPAGATDGEDDKSEVKAKNIPPRRRFQWNKDIRLLLNQVVYLKAECFHWSKLRKESAEEYLTRFLDTEVKSLWPKGWMSTKILFKESKEAHTFITSKVAPKLSSSSKKSGSSLLVGLMDTLALPSTSQSHTASSSSVPVTAAPTTSTAVSTAAPSSAPALPVATATPPTSKESKKSHVPREKISPVSTPSRVDTLHQSKPEGVPSKRPESSSGTSIGNNNSSTATKPETGHNRTDPVPMSNRSDSSKNRTDASSIAYARSEKTSQPQVLDSLSTSHSHQAGKTDSGGSRHRQESNNHNSSSRPISESVSKSEHSAQSDASRNRSDTPHMPKSSTSSTIHVRPDLCVARPDRSDSGSKRSDPNPKTDLVKGRSEGHHSTPPTHKTSVDSLSDSMKSNRFESSAHFSRVDSMQIQSTSSKTSDSVLQVKAEAVSNSKGEMKPHKAKTPLNPSMASSLASFVDSGFQWKEQIVHTGPDSEEKSVRPPAASEQSRSSLDNSRSMESAAPRQQQQHDEPEDQEMLLQRDLAMVMEELTRQADVRDDPLPKADARTKSVIKSTGSVAAAAPSVSASQPPPKMPSPTVSVLSKSTPVSRTSPLPAAAPPISPSSATKMTSPSNPSGSSRLVSPQSINHPLSLSVSNLTNEISNSGSNLSKYGGIGLTKVPSSEYLTPPTAHSSSSSSSSSNRQHLGPFFSPPDISQHAGSSMSMLSPDKRKTEPSAPQPAHQQHSSTSMSRNASIFRNYPSSSAQSATTSPVASSVSPVSSRAPSTYHSIESLMQNRSVADSFAPSAHRPSLVNLQQQQQPQQHSIPKIPDPFAMFLPQKNSTQRGPGHHQHSS